MKLPRWVQSGILLIVVVLFGTGCGYADSKTNQMGVVMSGGITEDAHFVKCFQPGANNNSIGAGSKLYLYPTDQRTWIGGDERDKNNQPTGNVAPGADTREIIVVSHDGITLSVPFQLYYKLNTNCKDANSTLVKFHNEIGVKTEAWLGTEHDPNDPGQGDEADPAIGYVEMIRKYFQTQIERSLERAAQGLDWKPMYLTEEGRKAFEDGAVGLLKPAVYSVIGDNYFCGPGFNGDPKTCGEFTMTVGKPTPVDPKVYAGLEAAEANKAATVNQEQDNIRRAKEREAIEKDVALLGADNYTMLKLVESGKVQSITMVPPGTPLVQSAPSVR